VPRPVPQDSPVLHHAQDHQALQALLPEPCAVPGPPEPLQAPMGRLGLLSVVVVATGPLAALKTCLEHLRRGGPSRLDVVVVNNGAGLDVTTWLAGQRDVRVLRNAQALSASGARNQGVLRCLGEQVLVLEDNTLLPRHWGQSLVLQDNQVAIGAVAHGLRGDQHDPKAVYSDRRELQEQAARRRSAHRATTVSATSLAPPLLVRRSELLAVGGYHEELPEPLVDHELSSRLLSRGELAVAPGVLAHVDAPPTVGGWPRGETVPLLSAALIVRDEQAALPACLASLRGIVDEVVVCDTGSTDATVEIAAAMGARVIHTSWDDDFAAARNTVLAATRGTWVLSIDADEQLDVDDPIATRQALARSSDDALRVPIRSRANREDATGYEHQAARLLRRGAVEWVGAVHEVPARLGSASWLETPLLPGIRLDHDGYLEEVRTSRGKSDRNLRLAEKDLTRTPVGDPRRWKATYELARTLGVTAESSLRVLELTTECLTLTPPEHFRAGALVLQSGALLALGRLEQAEAAARAAGVGSVSTTLALGTVLEAAGHTAEAVQVLQQWVPDGTDPAKERLLADRLARLQVAHAGALLEAGAIDEAAAALEGLKVDRLTAEDLLVTVAVAGGAGDRETATWLLNRVGPLPAALEEYAHDLARALGLASPGRVVPAGTSA
jgi:glycosyltransferase involved in cell wall biosynthesis